ncbi:MAG: hypothetical protein ACFBSE_16145 [Prochloraceae cyanobacterium]
MLILSAKDIEYCDIEPKQSDRAKCLPELTYNQVSFFKVYSCSLNCDRCPDRIKKITNMCRKFLKKEVLGAAIILKEANDWSLWVSQEYLNLQDIPKYPEIEKPPLLPEELAQQRLLNFELIQD